MSDSKNTKPGPVDVDAYIEDSPAQVRSMLIQLRQAIKEAAPDAVERIAYGMPTYEYRGKLANFAGYERHVGLYGVVHEDKPVDREAQPFLENRSTLRFPVGQQLPLALIKRVVAARVRENDASHGRKG